MAKLSFFTVMEHGNMSRRVRQVTSERGAAGNGQSYRDQLVFDADHRNAQFLSTIARSSVALRT